MRARIPTVSALLALAAALPAQRPVVDTATPQREVAQDVSPQTVVPQGAPAGMAEIEQAGLRRHAFYFASDELGGRYTGTAGQVAAAEYVADWFEGLGLEPLGDPVGEDGRSYFQSYPVEKTFLDPERTGLRFGDDDHATGFGVLAGTRDDVVDVDGRLVFFGYGARDDIPDQLENGQIPLVLLRTRSRSHVRTEAQFMMGLGAFNKARQIATRLARAGAPTILFGVLHDDSGTGEMLNYAGLLPGKPLLKFGGDAGMAEMVRRLRVEVPMVFLSRATTLSAFRSLGLTVNEDENVVEDRDGAGDRDGAAHARLAVVVDPDAAALNACAVLRGSDPELAREAVVFSAHMDHMGTRVDGDVFNGADDNASGSASLLEVAEAFAKGERPRRSVIFLSVSGEELGLWGSAWYSDHPTWPLPDIVANVNIDMIGRVADLSGANEISITPSFGHGKYSSIAQGAAKLAGRFDLGLTNGDMFYARSDHYNFAAKGVPVVFFCDGEHEDYHQVTDTADKLDYAKIEKVARLGFWIGTEVANADARPAEIGRQKAWFDVGEAATAAPRRR